MRRCKNWVPKASWKALTVWRPVPPVFPEHGPPHSWSPPWTPFRGVWRSAAAVLRVLILVGGRRQAPIRSWHCLFLSTGPGMEITMMVMVDRLDCPVTGTCRCFTRVSPLLVTAALWCVIRALSPPPSRCPPPSTTAAVGECSFPIPGCSFPAHLTDRLCGIFLSHWCTRRLLSSQRQMLFWHLSGPCALLAFELCMNGIMQHVFFGVTFNLLKIVSERVFWHTAEVLSCVSVKYFIVWTCPQLLSHVQLFATPWTVARQAPLSIGFSRREYSGLPFPPPGDLPEPGIEAAPYYSFFCLWTYVLFSDLTLLHSGHPM